MPARLLSIPRDYRSRPTPACEVPGTHRLAAGIGGAGPFVPRGPRGRFLPSRQVAAAWAADLR